MPSRLKKWIETHPAAVLTGVTIAVAATASSVTAYLASQVYSAEKAQTQAEKTELQNKYNSQIIDLTSRLSSIQRRVGNNQEKEYFDVQSLQISAPEIKNLPAQYKNYDNGSFFVNLPISSTWRYMKTTEGEVFKLGPFKSGVERIEQIAGDNAKILMGSPVHAWTGPSTGEISFQLWGNQVDAPVTPYAYIMKIDAALISQRLRGLSAITSARFENQNSNATPSDLNNAISKIEQIRSDSSVSNSQPNLVPSESDSGASNRLKEEMASFERMYSGDTAGFVFIDALSVMQLQSISSPTMSFTLHSAQKQLNVMYIDAELVISNAKITKPFDEDCPNEAESNIHLRHEVFFISYGSEGYVIRTEVPSCDGRSKAFDWISRWLAGLKILILRPS
jgi:hypothetical protein